MDAQTRELVHRRAEQRCECCHLPQAGHNERFSVDHIIALKHGGDDSNSNLALSCLRCNLHKGPNLSGIDPLSGQIVPLFHPRRQIWQQPLRWDGPILAGLTPEGRTTILVMQMNALERTRLRQTLIIEGLLPLV